MEAASSDANKIRVSLQGGRILELDVYARKRPRVADIVESLPRASELELVLAAKVRRAKNPHAPTFPCFELTLLVCATA